MAGRARFAARSKRPPTTKCRIPVKPGGKIRDWYLSRAAPTSVRPMERAADNSKPAARIASSGINGNSRVATARMTNKSVRHPNVGAASPGPSLIKIGAVRKPVLMAIHMKAHRIQPVVGYDIAQRSNENTPSWKASTDSLGAPVPDCETTIQVTSYVSLSLSRATGSLTTDIRLGRCGK
jgi:hypothetical protein